MPAGQREVKLSALTGYTYELYKLVYDNGELIERVLVNTSVYRPRRAEVIEGTMVAESNNEDNSATEPVSAGGDSEQSQPEPEAPPISQVDEAAASGDEEVEEVQIEEPLIVE
jgi:hypothetical protein